MDKAFVEMLLESIYSASARGIGMNGDRVASMTEFVTIRSLATSALKEFGRKDFPHLDSEGHSAGTSKP